MRSTYRFRCSCLQRSSYRSRCIQRSFHRYRCSYLKRCSYRSRLVQRSFHPYRCCCSCLQRFSNLSRGVQRSFHRYRCRFFSGVPTALVWFSGPSTAPFVVCQTQLCIRNCLACMAALKLQPWSPIVPSYGGWPRSVCPKRSCCR